MPDDAQHKVSPNNPCPFLRSLVAEGLLDDRGATIGDATEVIERVAATGEGAPRLPSLALRVIALLANGLGPAALLENAVDGVRLNKLRNGPFDKQGNGSRILDTRGRVRLAELDRLKDFASTKTTAGGGREPPAGFNRDPNRQHHGACTRSSHVYSIQSTWALTHHAFSA